MTLLLSTCREPLSEREFVDPIARIVGECELRHYTETTGRGWHDRIILCGTALQDDQSLDNIDQFDWIRNTNALVLGVCAGAQILVKLFGGEVTPGEGDEIGMKEVRTVVPNPLCSGTFEAYCMHRNGIRPSHDFTIVAETDTSPQVLRHRSRPLWGVLFHPEVRQEEIVRRFLSL